MLAQAHWDTQKAKQIAESILKTKDETTGHNRKMKEMKDQMLDYMKEGKLADFHLEETNKKLVAVESPVRLTLTEAIRVKFTQDGTDPNTIEDWLKEVKEIRRTGIKSTRRVMKIAKIRKEKVVKEAKAAKHAKGGANKAKAGSSGRKGKVRFVDQNEENQKKSTVPSLEPNAPMQVVSVSERKE